jgi:hypothetical protein
MTELTTLSQQPEESPAAYRNVNGGPFGAFIDRSYLPGKEAMYEGRTYLPCGRKALTGVPGRG